jgi:uncharacterized membrane protein
MFGLILFGILMAVLGALFVKLLYSPFLMLCRLYKTWKHSDLEFERKKAKRFLITFAIMSLLFFLICGFALLIPKG